VPVSPTLAARSVPRSLTALQILLVRPVPLPILPVLAVLAVLEALRVLPVSE